MRSLINFPYIIFPPKKFKYTSAISLAFPRITPSIGFTILLTRDATRTEIAPPKIKAIAKPTIPCFLIKSTNSEN
jgi:hypothetical protein